MKKKDLAYSVLTYLTAALAVILGFLCLALALRLFYSPEQYTQQGAAKSLLYALPLIIVFILDIIFVGAYSTVKGYATKDHVNVNNKDKYQAIMKMVDPAKEKQGALAKEKKIRLIILLAGLAFALIVCALPYAIYFVNYALHTLDATKDPTQQVITLLVHAIPWLALALADGIFVIYLRSASYGRALKEAAKCIDRNAAQSIAKENKIARYVSQGVILCLAIGLITYGALHGEAGDVLKKAAAICTECIGLG